MNKSDFLIKHETILSRIYRFFGRNTIKVQKGNFLLLGNAFLKRSQIHIYGNNNVVEIAPGLTRLTDCSITILGSSCHIIIGRKSNLNHCRLYIEDDKGEIIIGKHLTTIGETSFAVIEGKKITVGNDCLFATDISFRVGDSHSILDLLSGIRVNPSKDITIGDHVWIGHGVKILKGAKVNADSIVATGAIVTEKSFPGNSIIGGIPARVIKEGINWCSERISVV